MHLSTTSLLIISTLFLGAFAVPPPPIKLATTSSSHSLSISSSTTKAAPIVYATPAYDGGYLNTVLKHHNVHRANHSAPALQWGPQMAEWAQVLAERCVFAHNTSIGTKAYGQNIAAGTKPSNISEVISDEFYNGEVNWYQGNYGQPNTNMTDSMDFGHFTQVVWKGTGYVGCATVNCASKGGIGGLEGMGIEPWMTVCNYWPPGNYLGQFGQNVGSPLGRPTITGYY